MCVCYVCVCVQPQGVETQDYETFWTMRHSGPRITAAHWGPHPTRGTQGGPGAGPPGRIWRGRLRERHFGSAMTRCGAAQRQFVFPGEGDWAMLSKAGVHLPGSWGLRGHSGRPADTLRTPCGHHSGCPEGAHFPGTVSLSTSKGHDARGGTNTMGRSESCCRRSEWWRMRAPRESSRRCGQPGARSFFV